MIRVINKRHHPDADGEYIGRPSPLGNPFSHIKSSKYASIMVSTRREAVSRYREWLEEQPEDSEAKKAFRNLVEKYKRDNELVLICWCAPADCHGHVLADMIEEKVDV
jgi:hypothetical protein